MATSLTLVENGTEPLPRFGEARSTDGLLENDGAGVNDPVGALGSVAQPRH